MVQRTRFLIKYLKLQVVRHGRELVVEISIVGTICLMRQLSDMIQNLFPYIAVSTVGFFFFFQSFMDYVYSTSGTLTARTLYEKFLVHYLQSFLMAFGFTT